MFKGGLDPIPPSLDLRMPYSVFVEYARVNTSTNLHANIIYSFITCTSKFEYKGLLINRYETLSLTGLKLLDISAMQTYRF